MNIFLRYIKQGIRLILLSLLIVFIAQYINIVYVIGIFIILKLFVQYLLQLDFNKDIDSTDLSELENFSNYLINKYNIHDISIKITNNYSGMLQYNIIEPNVLYIPSDANPENQTEESKAVIAHELAHVIYNDIFIFELIRISLICILSILFYILYPILELSILIGTIILFLFIIPYMLNYIMHQFEYRADKFAVKHTSKHAVSLRLRRNKFNTKWYRKYFPYLMPHPSIEKRLQNIFKH